MKQREGEPWMPAIDYAHSLRGLGVNLVSADLNRALEFQREVLGVEIIYSDADFAALRGFGSEWMIHADHTYTGHPLETLLGQIPKRGGTLELRLHGCDPDIAESRARERGFNVLQRATDRPHGLREAYLLDGDGYLWVADVPVPV